MFKTCSKVSAWLLDPVGHNVGKSQTPDEGYTAGSMTIMSSGDALRQAAAEARRLLLQLAAERLDAGISGLVIRQGVISVLRSPERAVSYAELMGGKLFNRKVTGSAPLKPLSRVGL